MSTTVSVKPSASSRLTIRTSAHSLSFSSLTFDEGKMLITHENGADNIVFVKSEVILL